MSLLNTANKNNDIKSSTNISAYTVCTNLLIRTLASPYVPVCHSVTYHMSMER